MFEDDSDNKDEEPHSSPGPVNKEPAQSVKMPSTASYTPVTFRTYILTSVLKKGKQCKLKASDEMGKFCHLHKRQP